MNLKSILEDILHSKPMTAVYPRQFFIFWNGVPALAYQGFTPTLIKIKKEIENKIPGLSMEYPGSKWPKTTLGAIQDGQYLNREQFRALHSICANNNLGMDKNIYVEIDELSVVLFTCRSLEERLITHTIKLDTDQERDMTFPPVDHVHEINQAMEEFSIDKLDECWKEVQKLEHRSGYYREPHIEATLVFDLPHPQKQPACIQEFIDTVNSELPDIFYWFAPESRHVTLRALAV